jgi:hypothetical protein
MGYFMNLFLGNGITRGLNENPDLDLRLLEQAGVIPCKIEHPIYNVMTVEEMIEMVQVLFPHMNFSDKCAFLVDIKLAEPQKFLQLWDKANYFLAAEEVKKFQHSQKNMVTKA